VTGTLGPLTLTGTDIPSPYASVAAQRKNTGIEGGVTLQIRDFDGVNDGSLSIVRAVGAVYDRFAQGQVSGALDFLDQTLSLSAFLEGRLSAEISAGLNLADTVRGLFDGEEAEIWASLADLFAMSLSADLAVPFRVAYDSTDPRVFEDASLAKLRLDQIEFALAPVLSEMAGGAIKVIDSILWPIYEIENFFAQEIPQPVPPAPIDVGIPGAPWPVNDVINFFANAPAQALNDLVKGLLAGLDMFPPDGKVTVRESIRAAATHYNRVISIADEIWQSMQSLVPGLVSTLNTTELGRVLTFIADSLDAQKQFMAQFFRYYDVFEQALDKIDEIEQLGVMYRAASAAMDQAGSLSGLTVPLGSFEWDILEGSVDYARINTIETILAPRANPEPTLTRGQAGDRLESAITRGAVASLAGAGQMHEHVYYHAGIDGVDAGNVDAINSLIGSSAVQAWLSSPRQSGPLSGEPDFASSPDSRIRTLGKVQQIVDAYNQIQRVVARQASVDDLNSLTEAFQALEMLGHANANDAMFRARHFNDAARQLQVGLLEGLRRQDLDTHAELQRVWDVAVAWNDLNGHRGALDNASPTPGGNFLSQEQLASVRLALLDRSTGPDSPWAEINRAIQQFSGPDFTRFYASIRDRAQSFNEAWVVAQRELQASGTADNDSVQDYARTLMADSIRLIADAAQNDNARATLGHLDFARAGITGLRASDVLHFGSFLDSPLIGRAEADERSEIQGLVDAWRRVLDVSSRFRVDPGAFYQAIETLFPDSDGRPAMLWSRLDPTASNGYYSSAAAMERVPFLNVEAGLGRPASRAPSLPLLQSIVASLPATAVDDYSELLRVLRVSHETLLLAMEDPRLWSIDDAMSLRPWGVDGTTSETAKAFRAYHEQFRGAFRAGLVDADLAVIGLTGMTVSGLREALIRYNDTYRPRSSSMVGDRLLGGSSLSEGFTNGEYFDFLPARKPLTIEDLDTGRQSNPQRIASALSGVPFLQEFWLALEDAGVEFPFLSDSRLLPKLLSGEIFDLIRFTPKLPSIENESLAINFDLANLLPYADVIRQWIPISLPVGGKLEFSLIPRLSLGVDSLWLDILRSVMAGQDVPADWLEKLGNSFYIMDRYNEFGEMVDRPELQIDLSLLLNAGVGLGSRTGIAFLGGELFGGIGVDLKADLITDDPDGKLRMHDMLSKILAKPEGIFDVLRLTGDIGLEVGGELLARVDTDPPDGLAGLDVVASTLLQAYNLVAPLFALQQVFEWNPKAEFDIPLAGFDSLNGTAFFNTGFIA
jgi:hypothetical protein